MGVGLNLVERLVAKPIKWFSNTKVAENAGNQVNANNRKYIDGLGVASIIAKDGLGCYLYVTQSLHNKDIPDDKRKFVASLDLTNGVLMIALQLLMFFTVSHKVCQTKMFDKFFGKLFDRPIQKTYRAITKKSPIFNNVGDVQFSEEFLKIRNNVKDAFGGLTSLAAATIVGKRMLVPFIATPLADKVKKWMDNKDAQKGATETKKSPEPTMQGSEKKAESESEHKLDTGSTNLLEKYKQK